MRLDNHPMRHMRRLFFTFACVSVITACQNKSDNAKAPDASNRKESDGDFSLTYQSKFAEILGDVVVDSLGQVWISRSSSVKPDAEVISFIEKRDPKGQKSGQEINLGAVQIASFAVLNDGHLVAAVYREKPNDEMAGYDLRLIMLDPSGLVLAEKDFEDFHLQDPADFRSCFNHDFYGSDAVRLKALGTEAVLQTHSCQYSRLSLLNSDLDIIWSKEISTQRSDAVSVYGRETLHVTDDGTIYSTSLINEADVAEFNAHFADALEPKGNTDVLVNAYNSDGRRLFSSVVGTERSDACDAFTANRDKAFFAGVTRVDRPTSANNTQSDVWLAGMNVSDKVTAWQKTVEVLDEETVNAIALVGDGLLAIGGSAGSLQVPTHSIVKHGDAFVLLTDLNGNVVGKTLFGTPRADYVSSIVPLNATQILVGGGKDGPITHDGDVDKTQMHRFAFIDTLRLEDILGK